MYTYFLTLYINQTIWNQTEVIGKVKGRHTESRIISDLSSYVKDLSDHGSKIYYLSWLVYVNFY